MEQVAAVGYLTPGEDGETRPGVQVSRSEVAVGHVSGQVRVGRSVSVLIKFN